MNDVLMFDGERRSRKASLEAISWGKERAQESPCWCEQKWQRVALLMGVEFIEGARDADAA